MVHWLIDCLFILFDDWTRADRDKLEFRKKVREGKNLEQYNTSIAEFIDREDSYEALVTLMDMYTNNVQPDVETFSIFFELFYFILFI